MTVGTSAVNPRSALFELASSADSPDSVILIQRPNRKAVPRRMVRAESEVEAEVPHGVTKDTGRADSEGKYRFSSPKNSVFACRYSSVRPIRPFSRAKMPDIRTNFPSPV